MATAAHAPTTRATGASGSNATSGSNAASSDTTVTGAPRRMVRAIGKAVRVDLTEKAKRDPLPLTFRELCDLYAVSIDTQATAKCGITKWAEQFGLGDLPAWSITREQLQAGAQAMAEHGYAVSSTNRNLSQIGMVYKWAIAQKFTPEGFTSPTLGMAREPEPMRVIEPAKPGEWQRMRTLAKGFQKRGDQRFTLLVWLLMDTGARRAEIDERTWADFDLDAPEGPHVVLKAEDVKTGRARRLYFSHETAQLLRRLRPAEKYRHALVFASRSGLGPNKYRKPWSRMVEMLGRPGLHMHDLRHMVAAELLTAGHGMLQVSELLGHSSMVLKRRYAHLDDAAVRGIQALRLGLDAAPSAEAQTVLDAVADAKTRQAQREQSAGDSAMAEAQRLQLVATEAMAAAMAAAQALATMRQAPTPGARPSPLAHLVRSTSEQA